MYNKFVQAENRAGKNSKRTFLGTSPTLKLAKIQVTSRGIFYAEKTI